MRRLVFYTLFLILATSNAYARETKKEKKYRAGEFRKALISLDRSYLIYKKSDKCDKECMENVKDIKNQWHLSLKSLVRRDSQS